MKGYVYLIHAEPISKRYYIGITVKTLKQRLNVHKAEVNSNNGPKNCWIKKHFNDLKIEPLEIFNDNDLKALSKTLAYWEMFYISLFKSWNITLLNFTNGGDGYKAKHSKETKVLLSKISTGRKRGPYNWSADGKERISNGGKKRVGRKHTDETKKKMGEWQRGANNSSFGKIPYNVIKSTGHPVICVNTGEMYRSINQAATLTGLQATTIKRKCNLKEIPTDNYKRNTLHFQYISKEFYYGKTE